MLNDPSSAAYNANPEKPVPHLDSVAAMRWLTQRRQTSPWLNEEAARRMLDRLACIKGTPNTWANWAPTWGGLEAHQTLLDLWSSSQPFVYDVLGNQVDTEQRSEGKAARWNPLAWLSQERVRRPERPPEGGLDVLWANMLLHLSPTPKSLLQQWQRLLKVGGFVMFSALGPDSFKELRDLHRAMDWPQPMHPMTDMHDWGDMLVELGFSAPVMDVDRFQLSYSSANRLLEDLRVWGRNLHDQRFTALRGRAWRDQWLAAAERILPRNGQGELTVSVEMVFGHAIKTTQRLPVTPTLTVGLDVMREQLRRQRPEVK